jgi:hypothetical protein
MANKTPLITIALSKWQWAGVAAASPFGAMLGGKLTWQTLTWWASVVFATELAQETAVVFTLIFMTVILLVVGMFALIEERVVLRVRP